MSKTRQDVLCRKLATMCAVDFKPISMVEGSGFRYFCHELNPEYVVPSRKTVKSYIEKLYEEEKMLFITKMKDSGGVSMTSDLWTSSAVQGYITVTGHFSCTSWILNNAVMEERHTGVNIGAVIDLLRCEFEIHTSPALTTDNASNMTIAANEIKVAHVNCCFSHTIQLAINDGLKLPQISKVLGAARKLVSHFNYSVNATNSLLSKQECPRPLKLVQDVATRWNSSFYMLQRLLKLQIPVYGVIFDDSVTKSGDRVRLDIKDSFWKVMEDIVPILEPLEQITELLGKEDVPTGSQVFILLYSLINNDLKLVDGDSGVVKDLKSKFVEGLQKRFDIDNQGVPNSNCVANSPLLVASVHTYLCIPATSVPS